MTEPTTAAQAAARWWADKISGRVFHDNGGRDETSMFAGAMAGILAERHPTPAEEQFKRFEEHLTGIIQAKLDQFATFERVPSLTIGTDYGPGQELAQAAKFAEVPFSRFPWKTMMWVRTDHVTVSAGYQAQTILVWQHPEWERPVCASQHGVEDERAKYGWRYLPQKCGKLRYHEGPHGDFTPAPLCARCGDPKDYPDHQVDRDYAVDRTHAYVPAEETVTADG